MNAPKARILLAEPDPELTDRLLAIFGAERFAVSSVETAADVLAELEREPFDLVLASLELPGAAGTELLVQMLQRTPELPVVLLSGAASIELAVEAMKLGAADFVTKPLVADEIRFVVDKALTLSANARDASPEALPHSRLLLGDSAAILQVQDTIRRAAPTMATVLIRGESGTGKELVAQAIHDQSLRSAGPLIRVNCAALPDTLLESELFGHERGAFTGAVSRKPGRVELAEGGTLFLDEIGDISTALQAKLFRLLANREYDPLGGTKTQHADVRFIAATSRDLDKMRKAGTFREDFFFRLNVVPIRILPLRERPEDIERLARHFCSEVAQANARPGTRLDKAALDVLRQQRWRGNVRELQNFIERLVILSDGPTLSANDVQRELLREPAISTVTQPKVEGSTLEERMKAAEHDAIVWALKRSGDNRALAARLLAISRRTLYTKLQEHDLL